MFENGSDQPIREEISSWEHCIIFAQKLESDPNSERTIDTAIDFANCLLSDFEEKCELDLELCKDEDGKYTETFLETAEDIVEHLSTVVESFGPALETIRQVVLKQDVLMYNNQERHEAVYMSNDDMANVVPLYSVGDGRCFFHSISQHFFNDKKGESRYTALFKLGLAVDMFVNKDKYVNILGSQDENEKKWKEIIVTSLSKTLWSNCNIINCMARCLDRKIVCYRRFSKAVDPFKTDYEYNNDASAKRPLLIAYVQNTKHSLLQNHYVALLRKNENSEIPNVITFAPSTEVHTLE